MAPRLPVISSWWKQAASRMRSGSETYATATQPKGMAYARPLEAVSGFRTVHGKMAGALVPVYVALGLIGLQVALGLHTAYNLFRNAPSVRVKKNLRETLPEVEYPEVVAEEAERFFRKSFFRKVAHVQDYDRQEVMSNPIRKDAYAYPPRVESLKSVGVDPKLHT